MIFSFLYLFTFVKWSSKSIHIFLLKTHKLVSAGYLYSFQPCISTCISKLFSKRSCWHQLISTELLIFLCQNLPLFLWLIIMSLTFQPYRPMLKWPFLFSPPETAACGYVAISEEPHLAKSMLLTTTASGGCPPVLLPQMPTPTPWLSVYLLLWFPYGLLKYISSMVYRHKDGYFWP